MDHLIGYCQKLLTSPPVKAWLEEQWNRHFKLYESRVGELKDVVEKLKRLRDKIKNKVDEEEHRHGREILDEVKKWIERVNQLIFEYDDFNEDDTDHELALFNLLKSGYLPKPGIRYRQSRKAYDITREAKELLQKAKFDTFSYWSGPPSMAAFFSNIGYESFPSREEAMRKIIEELEKPSVRMIGLHGLSGVGKTTLVKEVVKQALKDKMFNVVTMASVTKSPDIRKIQGQIVDMLGVILDEESDIARAARIQKILKNEKKSTLIILDDLWEKLDFNMLGVPYEIDNDDGLKNVKGKSLDIEGKSLGADDLENVKEGKYPTDHSMMKRRQLHDVSDRVKIEKSLSQYKGCKVLMISESKQVLLSQMEGRAESIFSVEVLKEKEAEMLFKKMAGIGDKNSEFEKLAAQIANKCNGLPMSIITTARALKNQSRSIWEDIHRKVELQKLTGAPEFSTKLSYNLLESEELKYNFLLCAHMGHDALIMDLVKCCIGLGFLHGIYTVKETRDRVYALVGKLIELGLLSDSYSSDHFTMQDIVRSAALSIAYKNKFLFAMSKEKIGEWPHKLSRYMAISLYHCDFIGRFLRRINCPRLSVFQFNNNVPHLKIPRNFFKGMKEVKVLILTGIHLSLLNSSISSLRELRMLCLEQCSMLDKELSIIGKLEKLKILSFSGTDIEKLPNELKKLKELQILDISNCSRLREIPSGVISSLVSLEELYMRNTLIQWELEEHNESKRASLSELKYLNQLTTLDIQIPDVSYLPKNLFFDKLYSYKIVIGDLTAYLETDFKMPEKHETLRFLAIQLKDEVNNIHSLKGIKILFERVENLFLEELNAVQDIFYRLNLMGFPYLKHLLIVNNSTIESLIHPKDRQHPEKAFPKLESLYLYNLKKMDRICSCKLSEPSFGKLKVIKLHLCGQLKNVFLISVVKLLTVLESIEVSECNSLKEIVPVERQSNIDEVKPLIFPELRSLKLAALSEFIGFYPIPSREREEKELFHEKVEVSKLERMELSLIQIDIIWSVRSSQCSSFKQLSHLDVNGCWKLKYLISFSMVKSLVNLQSLFVSECEKMRSIFPIEQDSHQKMKGSIFPKLKNIKLSSMKSLSEIWNSNLPSDSFSKLDTLIIEECDKLVNVFPCYIEGIFQSLCNLRVTNCRSMQAIFNIFGQVRYVATLQDVHLEKLPKLDRVWKLNEDQGGILNMNNLQKIWVQDCNSLENIFPFTVAKYIHNLDYLVVCNCIGLREIVSKREATNTDTFNLDPSFNFPKLTTVKFSELPKLTSFYPGSYKLLCPTLNDLSIELCDKLEPFNKEAIDAQRKPVLFPEKVINKLKSMQIESWHAKSPSSYMGEGNHRRDNLEELCLSRLTDTELLYSFLHRNPNLKSLSLNNCFFEEILPLKNLSEIENLGVVPKLKSLKLIDLPKLKEIGFEQDILLERIEFLILKNCPCMITVVPPSAFLTHLTNLEVVSCDGLKNLMSLSAAKSLGQLNTMKVIKCESLVEILGKEGENHGEVVFKQLKALELVSLKNLKSFCCSNSWVFQFPSLEILVVSACYKMENFSGNVTSSSTPILQNVYVVYEKEKKRCCRWEGDLNATIQKIFDEKKCFEGMDEMSFSEHTELRQAWQGEVDLQDSWFCSLKILKLENCEIQPCAIPSNILPYLKSLKELQVRDCDNVEVIFDMNVTEGARIGTTFQLQKLTLQSLPKLRHVWKKNGNGTHSFQSLQVVFVGESHNLQTVFPAAVAKNLKKLNTLEIKLCGGLREIVGKEEDAAVDVTQEEFVFPCLTKLNLQNLAELTYFYPESFTLECPLLSILYVFNCPKFEPFESAYRQPLFLDINDISNLEELSLRWEHMCSLKLRSGELKGYLQYLNDIFLCFSDIDEREEHILPIEILQMAPNLIHMTICCCPLFCIQIPEIDENRMLTHLKSMTLKWVSKLQSIGSENSPWLNAICDKLHGFNVYYCPDLTTLVHSTSAVSFSCLKELYIYGCDGLEYLFTSSAANKLMHLERIQVWECKSMKEIVAKDQNETTSRGIKLERLYRIDLNILESLEYFSSGNDTLQLPSLMQVDVWKCPKMEIFSPGSVSADSFRGIQASCDENDELVLSKSNDVNSSVKEVFLQQGFFKAVDEEYFSVNLIGRVGLQNQWLRNLVTLKLHKCALPYAIPSAILLCLKNLEELKVADSDRVEVVFDMNDTDIMETISQLKKLTLEQLSSLVRVWEKNTRGVLIFENLQEVVVSDCENLQTLFPASLAKNLQKLEKLEIQYCHKLLEIVEKEESAAADLTEKFVFPCLEELYLFNLSQLTYFYSQTFTLECPTLNKLFVVLCPNLELFQSAHSMGESTSINRRPVISNLKIISKLKELRLDWKHIWALTLRFRSEEFPEGLEYLEYISLRFNRDENEKAMLPIEILQKAPNLINMTTARCDVPDILFAQNPKIGENGILGQLKVLKLWKVSALQSMELENSSWLNTICEKLHELLVFECPDLTTLAHTVSFSCLKELFISNCPRLQYLFTSSAAKKLMNLEKMTVKECESMKEIVTKEGDATSEAIRFGRLNTIVLNSLASLVCFYSGSETLHLSSLVDVYVWQCPNMKIFSNGVIDAECFRGIQMSLDPNEDLLFHHDLNATVKDMFQRQAFFQAVDKECFSDNLELQEDWRGKVDLQSKWLCNLVILKLSNCTLPYAIPSAILLCLKNLEELKVADSDRVQVVFDMNDTEIMETTSQLKKLTFQQLSSLVHVWEKNSHAVLVFENLQEVIISDCENLQTLFPASLAKNLEKLEKLEIESCHKLQYLFTSSAAKKLMNLEEMTVKKCDSMKEIVAKEGDASSEAIQYGRLNTIVLHCLQSLICFYSGSETLHLSSLVDVHVWECPNMKIFSNGVIDAECFRGIQMSLDPNEDLLFHHDLNATVKDMLQQQAFFQAVDKECFSDNPELQKDWRGKVDLQSKWLCNLVTLKLGNCTLPHPIPSTILPCLKNLQELEVRDSDKVEVIFYMNDTEIMERTSQLKKLTLQQLSNLVHVWEKNSHGVLIFQNLQEVIVRGCENLQTLFPPSLAKSLQKLEKLEIESCHKLQEIVKMEESTAADVTEKFVFPRLKKLHLHNLPQVTYFYPQTISLECPALTDFSVVECDKLELFQSAHPVNEGEGTSINRRPVISNLRVISNLKKLKLDWKHIWTLSLRLRSEEFAEGLSYLENISLYLDTDMLPFEILQKAPNLIEMTTGHCNDPEILLAQNPKICEDGILGQLKILTLHKVSILQSIGSEYSSWLNTICEKLHELNVDQCSHLTTLVHSTSTVSFSCLKKVSVSNCPQMQYLFTSSAAKKLMNLEEMTVKKCDSMKEIVAKEGDATSEAIQFGRLNTIVLHCLPSLICFYSGSDTLYLSSLVDLHVWQCPDMKIFSQGDIDADLLFHHGLDATVRGMFQRQAFFQAVDKDCFSNNLELQEDWRGKVNLQNQWLCNLVTLKLHKCALPYAIPSAILLCLKNLEELKVADSDRVEVVFDMNDTEIMETTSQLKKLTLQQLSSLVRVWEKNSHGVLVFENLKEVIVSGCQNLQTLFPASLAKILQKLEKLEIRSCHKLQEMVEIEESTAADVTENFVLPCLEKLHLYNLPRLTYFYPQTFTVEFPALNKLFAFICPNLELFQIAHSMGESTSINRLPLISNIKVISKLKDLRLDWKHISALTLRCRSEEFPEGLKYLENISLRFNQDKNKKAMFPIEILQKAPNLIEMTTSHCHSPEILFAQNPKNSEDGILGQLKVLTLRKVYALQSIELEDSSWLNTICEKLYELHVFECPDLTTLVHTVSFSCLKKLNISNCPKLQYLFTSSAAKKLMNLEEITVKGCESLKEIMAKDSKEGDEDEHKDEGEDKYENEMVFGKLEYLKLQSLPTFENFYMGSSTLNFISLKEVWFNQCYSTKLFRLRDKMPVKLKVAIDGFYKKGDIHSLVVQQLEEEAT